MAEARSNSKLETVEEKHEKLGYDAVAVGVMQNFKKMREHRDIMGIDEAIADCENRFNNKDGVHDVRIEDDSVGQLDVGLGITRRLCDSAYRWLEYSFFNAQDRPWALEPTPNPTLPADLQARVDAALADQIVAMTTAKQLGKTVDQDREALFARELKNTGNFKAVELAKAAIVGMERSMEDDLVECRWRDTLQRYLLHFVKYPFAVVKGPLYGPQFRKKWNGTEYEEDIVNAYYFENVLPFDIFWSPEATSLKSARAIIHRAQMTASEILMLEDMDDVVKDHIDLVLADMEPDLSDYYKIVRNDVLNETTDNNNDLYQVYHFYGLLTGTELLEFCADEDGIDLTDIDYQNRRATYKTKRFGEISLYRTYDVYAMVCKGYTLLLRSSPSVSQSRPFHSASSYPRGDGIMGSCIPLILSDIQDATNYNFKSMVMNALMSAGPIHLVNAERFAGKDQVIVIKPWSSYTVSHSNLGSANATKALEAYHTPSNLQQYIATDQHLEGLAHKQCGLPLSMQGENIQQPRTLGATALLRSASNKTIQTMIAQIDHGIIEPMMEQFYDAKMRFDDDLSIKADARVRVRGAQGLIAQEQRQMRPTELATSIGPLLPLLPPEEAQAIVKSLVTETLREYGYDPATLGLTEEGLASQEAQARALEPPPLDGRSAPAQNADTNLNLPPPT